MTKKEQLDKFKKVPQVEIDDKYYHESAEVSFGIKLTVTPQNKGGNIKLKRLYQLVKYVMIRGKVVDETVIRAEEDLAGKPVILAQSDIEIRKELKRREQLIEKEQEGK